MTETLAILSDIHAHAAALERALRVLARRDISRVVCAGDLVGYGGEPGRVLALMREHRIPCVRGNHDRWTLHDLLDGPEDDATRAYLASLPPELELELAGQRVVVTHGAPGSDMRWVNPAELSGQEIAGFLAQARTRVLVVGHTHRPALIEVVGRGHIVNPGATLGRLQDPDEGWPAPRDDGTLGLLTLSPLTFEVLDLDGNPVPVPTIRVIPG
ncbi:MAG TPA: metallophosphoesterase family protein [Myxococcota bacterium]|nr:metallophosphoesterase family protein [Myxococcota bacterium]HRY97131.1 metallophosphoesterase family protein [Myxococcota bacterium]HSA21208.1 metallophosphoesterase family protein [Myxococcota bacterium]